MPNISDVWGLANNIIRSSRMILNENLKPLGLTSAEANILLQLVTEGDMVRQEDLAELLDVSKPAISRALDTLESKEYVARERDLSDKRACLVVLTPKANAAAVHIKKIYQQMVEVAEIGLTPDETTVFMSVFGRVSDNLAFYRNGPSKGAYHPRS